MNSSFTQRRVRVRVRVRAAVRVRVRVIRVRVRVRVKRLEIRVTKLTGIALLILGELEQKKKEATQKVSLPFSEKLLNLLVAYSPTADEHAHTFSRLEST